MIGLVNAIVSHVREHVHRVARGTTGQNLELRSAFHGPPAPLIEQVFAKLQEPGALEVELAGGRRLQVPVLLQVEVLPEGVVAPAVGESGVCTETHLLNLRNSPTNPTFVALVPPAHQRNLSVASASDDFGLAAENNTSTATIEQWWSDPFVQDLVAKAAECLDQQQRVHGIDLLNAAVQDADEAGRTRVPREAAWNLLARVFDVPTAAGSTAERWSLACGVPPTSDGRLNPVAQRKVLQTLTDELVDEGINAGMNYIREDAEPEEQEALGQLRDHLVCVFDVPTTLSRAPSYYYGPCRGYELVEPPAWWRRLTVERLEELLEEETAPEALTVRCLETLMAPERGLGAVVRGGVKLEVTVPSQTATPVEVVVRRLTGPVAARPEWTLQVTGAATIIDAAPPRHASPHRYSVEAAGYKKAVIKVVSLSSWEPGLLLISKTAKKTVLPRAVRGQAAGAVLETSMTLAGQGRHYIEALLGPGVTLGESATRVDQTEGADEEPEAPIRRLQENLYGFEVDATPECYYELSVDRPGRGGELLRLNLVCDETAVEGCASEFERLIRLNRQRGRQRGAMAVAVNRSARAVDLEGWLLDAERAGHSFYPLVLTPNYGDRWVPPDYGSPEGSIYGQARFLLDPRPSVEQMLPPAGFVEARVAICSRIRGTGEDGLVQSAKLGEWVATLPDFADLVDRYVRLYSEWLEQAPEVAAWVDVVAFTSVEHDGVTLSQDIDAILLNPLHPLRLGWQCAAQRAMWHAHQRDVPCPAAGILDPDCVPDVLSLPMMTAGGEALVQQFLSVETSSDYWGVLWSAARLDRLRAMASKAPFDEEFGIQLGGISSGFSVSQVRRSLDDVAEMLAAKPVLNVLVASAAGQSNACNEGLMSWARQRFSTGERDGQGMQGVGARILQILDERGDSRPEAVAIATLTEDTGNSVRWFSKLPPGVKPDLGIIAQLETSNARARTTEAASALGAGALVRYRVRQQHQMGAGAFLTESRTAAAPNTTGDYLLDRVATAAARLENLGGQRVGYTFAPSVHVINQVLKERNADFAAVSSSSVDPACFLGQWLDDSYLWDYELPSYSNRAGDTNGYYLLSRVKPTDRESLRAVVEPLPGAQQMSDDALEQIVLEVAKRGIPTVRGLSAGNAGASGDLGLFVAGRLLQDEFRAVGSVPSLLPVIETVEQGARINLVIPVDPFQGYLDDLNGALNTPTFRRPDLMVASILATEGTVACKVTPIEVKYRGGSTILVAQHRREALGQAQALSSLLQELMTRGAEPELVLWRLTLQHLLASMIGFGFRVYSQHVAGGQSGVEWSGLHQRVMEAIYGGSLVLEVDRIGRLVVLDASPQSASEDVDSDGFKETIVLSQADAGTVVARDAAGLYALVKARVGDWGLYATERAEAGGAELPPPTPVVGHESPEQGEPTGGEVPTARGGQSAAPADTTEAGAAVHPPQTEPPAVTPPVVAPPPVLAEGAGIAIHVGELLDAFNRSPVKLNISDTRLNQLNVGIVGDLGTGKTQLVKSLVYQIAIASSANRGSRPRFLIFDYKRDYSDPSFVAATGAKVVSPVHLPINLFDLSGAQSQVSPWLERFKFFADVLDKIYSGIGPVQRESLKQAVRACYTDAAGSGRQPTIYDIHARYISQLGNRPDTIVSILGDLVDMEIFTRDPDANATFGDFLDGVVVISLADLGQDDRTKNMIVAVMLNMFYEHMLRLEKRPFIGSDPQLRFIDSFLLVDEADNIMRHEFDVLRKLLLQGREFGVGVILASQYLSHFRAGATDYRAPLLTWFIHKVPNILPQELVALGMNGDAQALATRVRGLAMHQCLYKTHDIGGAIVQGMPFYRLNGHE